jgi:ribose 5-phosphate isomerase B
MTLRIVVGCDEAGLQYKDILRRDLEADDRVPRWSTSGSDPTSTPHIRTSPSPRPG